MEREDGQAAPISSKEKAVSDLGLSSGAQRRRLKGGHNEDTLYMIKIVSYCRSVEYSVHSHPESDGTVLLCNMD
jgi:hypothetical protein